MTDIMRIRSEIDAASNTFSIVQAFISSLGEIYVKVGLQTTALHCYVASVHFTNYPNQMPRVQITKPSLLEGCPHRFKEGNICYLHPSMWNPGRHDLTFVLARTAKWLNKYEVWRQRGEWPGAEVAH